MITEEFEDAKGVIIIRKSKKDINLQARIRGRKMDKNKLCGTLLVYLLAGIEHIIYLTGGEKHTNKDTTEVHELK
jgi:hypothetical protein